MEASPAFGLFVGRVMAEVARHPGANPLPGFCFQLQPKLRKDYMGSAVPRACFVYRSESLFCIPLEVHRPVFFFFLIIMLMYLHVLGKKGTGRTNP